MYRIFVAAAALCALISGPAFAAVVLGGPVDLSQGPSFTFGPSAAGQFTFSYPTSGYFADTFVSTSGSAQVTFLPALVIGGVTYRNAAPSVDFTDARGGDVIYGPYGVDQYMSFSAATDIPYSATDSLLGLRYSVGADTFYGFAQFAGSNLELYGFENKPNTAIDANAAISSAVPETSTWAMMILGFIGLGYMRYLRKGNLAPSAA